MITNEHGNPNIIKITGKLLTEYMHMADHKLVIIWILAQSQILDYDFDMAIRAELLSENFLR